MQNLLFYFLYKAFDLTSSPFVPSWLIKLLILNKNNHEALRYTKENPKIKNAYLFNIWIQKINTIFSVLLTI